MLNDAQGQLLIRLARQTIAAQLGIPDQPIAEAELDQPALREQRGVFVTLHKRGDLRGCIGSLVAAESIVDGIRRNAINAAFPILTYEAGLIDALGLATGDRIRVDYLSGDIEHLGNGRKARLNPFNEVQATIFQRGGLL